MLDPSVRRAAGAPVRHADRGRVRRLQQPVAGDAGRGRPRRAPAEGRPSRRLAAPSVERRSARVRGRRRRAPARAASTGCSSDSAATGGRRGRRTSARELLRRAARAARPGRGVVEDQGGAPAARPRHGRRAGRRRVARAPSRGARSAGAVRPARSGPGRHRAASAGGPRRRSGGSAGSTNATSGGTARTSCSPRSPRDSRSRGTGCACPPAGDVDRDLRPAVALISAWVGQLGRQLHIDSTLLATRSDIEALLRGDERARLAHGWRAEVLGQDIRRLVEGRAAIAFDGRGGLVLEDR